MPSYTELRPNYTKSPDERMALLERELAAPLAEATQIAADLGGADTSTAGELYGGRFSELVEILAISIARLAEVTGRIDAIRERGRAAGELREEEIHVFRHDLLTPIGTVRGVALMLAKAEVANTPGVPASFIDSAQRLASVVNAFKDILDALTETRTRGT
jgi:signal transduction histidine kinase